MKQQYFGDVNDYVKYSILRRLVAERLKVGVCWMMTPKDSGKDGRKLGYLNGKGYWEDLDPPLYEFLGLAQGVSPRGVQVIEKSPLMSGTDFFGHEIPDNLSGRKKVFDSCRLAFRGRDVVFFDPDNGMEIASKPTGRLGSNKFLAWSEAKEFFAAGFSIAVYQHFPRQPRDEFLAEFRKKLSAIAGGAKTYILRSPHVAFCLAAQSRHVRRVEQALSDFRGEGVGRTRLISA